MEKFTSVGPDWQRAGSSPAPRHTLDQAPQRRAEPTNATKPLATTVLIPLIWVSLAASVWAGARPCCFQFGDLAIQGFQGGQQGREQGRLARGGGRVGGRLSLARCRIRAATVTFS
jgi:hypothetical protein